MVRFHQRENHNVGREFSRKNTRRARFWSRKSQRARYTEILKWNPAWWVQIVEIWPLWSSAIAVFGLRWSPDIVEFVSIPQYYTICESLANTVIVLSPSGTIINNQQSNWLSLCSVCVPRRDRSPQSIQLLRSAQSEYRVQLNAHSRIFDRCIALRAQHYPYLSAGITVSLRDRHRGFLVCRWSDTIKYQCIGHRVYVHKTSAGFLYWIWTLKNKVKILFEIPRFGLRFCSPILTLNLIDNLEIYSDQPHTESAINCTLSDRDTILFLIPIC